MRDFEAELRYGYHPCLYEILYWLPDSPTVIAPPFLLQKMDIAPHFPVLRRFLGFWSANIDARLASVRVDGGRRFGRREINLATELRLS